MAVAMAMAMAAELASANSFFWLQLKCSGGNEGCDRCLSTSSACTYTFSSGTGAGRKRLRKVTTTTTVSFKSARLPQKPSPESTSRSSESSANATTHDDRQQDDGGRGEENLRIEPPGFLPFPETWPNPGMDMDVGNPFRVPSDGSDFSVGDGFTLCPGKIVSKVPPPITDRETAQITGIQASTIETRLLAPFELGQSIEEWNSPSQPMQPQPSSVSLPGETLTLSTTTPYTAPHTAPSTASPALPPTRHDASSSSSSSATNLPGQCGCLFSMLQTLEDLGPQTAASATAPSTDSLFFCIEQSMEKCRLMLSCAVCDTSASSPILIVTIANHMVVVVAEVVNRFIHCQTPDSVPTVFQFGRYCVEHPALRTRLLKSMIELHVRDLHGLIIRLESRLAGKQGSMLDDAKSKSEKMHRVLQDFETSNATICV